LHANLDVARGEVDRVPGEAPLLSAPLGEVPVPDALDLPFDDDLGRSESLWHHGRTLRGWREMVGATGFEPATSCSRSRRATKLRYAPIPPARAPSSGPAPTRPLASPVRSPTRIFRPASRRRTRSRSRCASDRRPSPPRGAPAPAPLPPEPPAA